MILVVDAGNTHVHVGLFTLGRLRATWKLATDPRRTDDEYAFVLHGILGEDINVDGAIISSVVPQVTKTLADAVRKAFGCAPMVLDASTEMGIINGYDHPNEVGMDRLAAAVGGYYFYGAPLLVLDYGTAITMEYLAAGKGPDGKPVYKGGVIMPGIRLAAESLGRGTAKLPTVDLDEPLTVIGRNTADSIRSGLVFGVPGAISKIIDMAREEIGQDCQIVATGGDAEWFREKLPQPHEVQPDLTLYGLRQIYGLNNGCPLTNPPANG